MNNTNDAPTVTTDLTTQSVDEDSPFSYQVPEGTFADVDAGDSLTYTATLADGTALPSWLHFDASTGTFTGTPENGDVGTISVMVTATDGSDATASSSFALTVNNVNDAPVVSGDLHVSVTEGGSVVLTTT